MEECSNARIFSALNLVRSAPPLLDFGAETRVRYCGLPFRFREGARRTECCRGFGHDPADGQRDPAFAWALSA